MAFATLRYADADGQHSVLLDRGSMTVGRLPDQDVVLREQCVSRRHAAILMDGDVYSIVDLNSTHGTYVNGVRVERAVLASGDQIQLGSVETAHLQFHMESVSRMEITGPASGLTTLLSSFVQFPKTDRKAPPAAREMEQLNWLLSAARQLNAGGAIDEILTTLLQLTLQLTGVERGFVFLREAGEMKLAQGLNAAGETIREEKTISRRAIQKAIESDQKFSISDTFSDVAASAWDSVMVNKIRSIYCIPLRKRDGNGRHSDLLGLLYLDSQLGAGNLSEVDHQLLDTIANEAAALLHNALLGEAEKRARRAREELAVAARIHSGLMAITMPVIPYAVLKARSVPCYEIGGDFFDALVLDDCVCVAIADVSGKGIPAAIVAATIQGIIHAQLLSGQSLVEVASLLNQFLCTRNVGKYATMVLLKLYADGRVEYMNCGHIQPLLVDDSGLQWLPESNLIVGLLPGASYTSAQITLQPGARILLVTDGLVEAENCAGEAIGDEGFTDIVPHLDVDGILDHVARFQAPNQAQDDCTLVEVRYTGGRLIPQG
jgi:sigma-B regulation protein RsbU (phosphoserine phosphatase)